MKKIIMTSIILSTMLFTMVGCNKDIFDTEYTFSKAIINFGNGKTVEVEITGWRDFDDGDQIQVKTTDGKVYLCHSSNCILVKE